MANIRRYPVPADSFDPNRPLNDLLQAQLEHFHEVEKRLPRRIQPTLHPDMPPPSPKDAQASNHYVATMTTLIRQRAGNPVVKPAPVLVTNPDPSPQSAGIAIAASSTPLPAPRKSTTKQAKATSKNKSAAPSKPKSRKP
jgi:hypothetical protein